jgi:low affinity Fe/Cu permease
LLPWGLSSPLSGLSDTGQLFVNTTTTIITFLMILLIQSTQSRNNDALHVMLDEVIRAMEAADNKHIGIRQVTDEELMKVNDEVERKAEKNCNEPTAQKSKWLTRALQGA